MTNITRSFQYQTYSARFDVFQQMIEVLPHFDAFWKGIMTACFQREAEGVDQYQSPVLENVKGLDALCFAGPVAYRVLDDGASKETSIRVNYVGLADLAFRYAQRIGIDMSDESQSLKITRCLCCALLAHEMGHHVQEMLHIDRYGLIYGDKIMHPSLETSASIVPRPMIMHAFENNADYLMGFCLKRCQEDLNLSDDDFNLISQIVSFSGNDVGVVESMRALNVPLDSDEPSVYDDVPYHGTSETRVEAFQAGCDDGAKNNDEVPWLSDLNLLYETMVDTASRSLSRYELLDRTCPSGTSSPWGNPSVE